MSSNEVNLYELDGRLQALVQQRDFALNQNVLLSGQLNKALQEKKELEIKLAANQAQEAQSSEQSL